MLESAANSVGTVWALLKKKRNKIIIEKKNLTPDKLLRCSLKSVNFVNNPSSVGMVPMIFLFPMIFKNVSSVRRPRSVGIVPDIGSVGDKRLEEDFSENTKKNLEILRDTSPKYIIASNTIIQVCGIQSCFEIFLLK